MNYIEVKTKQRIDLGLAQKIVSKNSVIAVVTTGAISKQAKECFEKNGIVWIEHIPEFNLVEDNLEDSL